MFGKQDKLNKKATADKRWLCGFKIFQIVFKSVGLVLGILAYCAVLATFDEDICFASKGLIFPIRGNRIEPEPEKGSKYRFTWIGKELDSFRLLRKGIQISDVFTNVNEALVDGLLAYLCF